MRLPLTDPSAHAEQRNDTSQTPTLQLIVPSLRDPSPPDLSSQAAGKRVSHVTWGLQHNARVALIYSATCRRIHCLQFAGFPNHIRCGTLTKVSGIRLQVYYYRVLSSKT